MIDKLEMPLEQFAEACAKENNRLISGPGGIMEMKQTIADREADIEAWKGIHEGAVLAMQAEITRLKQKCDTQAMILRRLTPDKFEDTFFIHSGIGKKDDNGMPAKLLVCPAYGLDFSYVYEYTGFTMGCEW